MRWRVMKSGHKLNLAPGVKKKSCQVSRWVWCSSNLRKRLEKGQQWRQEGARLISPLQYTHNLCSFLPVSVCLWPRVCPSGCLCVPACGSLQTDNHRGGRAKSKRDECSVYWNECKDRLQCQTGRICVCVRPQCLDQHLFHAGMRTEIRSMKGCLSICCSNSPTCRE